MIFWSELVRCEEFRSLLALPDSTAKYQGLSALSREFCYAAKLYAKYVFLHPHPLL